MIHALHDENPEPSAAELHAGAVAFARKMLRQWRYGNFSQPTYGWAAHVRLELHHRKMLILSDAELAREVAAAFPPIRSTHHV